MANFQKLRHPKITSALPSQADIITDHHRFDLRQPAALASTSESGLLNEVVTSEHDKEIIVALKILVNKGIIKAVRLIGLSKAEFEVLYPDVVKHVSLTDIDEGVIMI